MIPPDRPDPGGPPPEHTGEPDGDRSNSGERWALLDVVRDEDAAHEWLDALHAAGISAELRFEDGTHYSPLSSAYPTGPLFVYPLLVPEAEREAAAHVLIELGWNGRGGRRVIGGPRMVGGTVVAVGVGLLLALALLLRGV